MGGEEYMKLGGGGHTLYGADKRGGRGENKARNETPVLGSFKFNCLVPYFTTQVCAVKLPCFVF